MKTVTTANANASVDAINVMRAKHADLVTKDGLNKTTVNGKETASCFINLTFGKVRVEVGIPLYMSKHAAIIEAFEKIDVDSLEWENVVGLFGLTSVKWNVPKVVSKVDQLEGFVFPSK